MKSFFSALLDWDFFFLGILAERRQLNWRRILLLKSHYSVNVFNIKKRPKLAKISPMSDFMVNRSYFFIFVTWISLIICLNFGWYSRKWWQKKLKLWWYSWNAKQRGAEAREPNLGTRWFQFFFLLFMNTTKVSIFSAIIFVNTNQNYKKKSMKSRSQK